MKALLACQNLVKNFGGLTAVAGLDLQVAPGELVAVIGPNGAGKTTLFNLVSGAFPPSSGRILFDGRDVTGLPAGRRCRLGIARTYQLVRPFGALTCLENVLVGALFGRGGTVPAAERRAAGMGALRRVGLHEKADRRAEALTLVEKKRLEIARALATRPRLLLLDEVVSGLSPVETGRVADTIRQIRDEGVAVVMVEHVLRVVLALCSRAVVLDCGRKLADGAPEDVVRDPLVRRAYLGGA